MGTTVTAYIGLGSNLADPRAQVRRAISALARFPASELYACSSLYRSEPLGPPGQPDYINAVVALYTRLAPLALLDALQAQEQVQRRVREQHWGPRTLDLDLLLYADQTVDHSRLSIPHPEMLKRNFVLLPLAEIAPDLQFPDGSSLSERLAAVGMDGIERISSEPAD